MANSRTLKRLRRVGSVICLGASLGSSLLPTRSYRPPNRPFFVPTICARWSRQAEIATSNDESAFEHRIVTYDSHDKELSSPRDWLEHYPDGAYTVIRCDYFLDRSSTWKIWGRDFHLQRLAASYASLCATEGCLILSEALADILQRDAGRLLDHLLSEAKAIGDNEYARNLTQTFMVTLLCYSHVDKGYQMRGHICTAVSITKELSLPVQISVATHSDLPNRLDDPSFKLSSWCRQRKTIENVCKNQNVAEVILVHPKVGSSSDTDNWRLLEGLTSNLFVICSQNTIQTAPGNILHGYARHLVLEQAYRLGLTVVLEAPRLEDCESWQGMFLTSSIKLLVPVYQLIVPGSSNASTRRIRSFDPSPHPLCGQLLTAIHAAAS